MNFAQVHLVNHGFDNGHVGQVFYLKDGKFNAISSVEVMSRRYGDWTVITSVVDADNFDCLTGEDEVLELATNFSKKLAREK